MRRRRRIVDLEETPLRRARTLLAYAIRFSAPLTPEEIDALYLELDAMGVAELEQRVDEIERTFGTMAGGTTAIRNALGEALGDRVYGSRA